MAAFNLAPIALTTKAETSGFQTNPDLDKALGAETPPSTPSYTPPTPPTRPAPPTISPQAQERERILDEKALKASETVGKTREDIAALKSPDAPDLDKAPTRRRTDPMEAFGSTASVLAMIGSAFTKRPMLHALNNAAGVIEAFKANDQARAKEEFDLWKANTDAAITQFNMQNTAYKAALDKLSTNSKMALDEVQVLASQWGDPVMKELARTGALSQAVQHQLNIEKGVNDLAESKIDLEAMYGREQLVQELVASPEYAVMTPNQKAAKINEIRNPAKAGVSGSRMRETGNVMLPDGRIVAGAFDPAGGGLVIQDETTGEYTPAPPGTRKVSVNTGGFISPDNFNKLELQLYDEKRAINRLNKYVETVGDLPQGVERLALDLSAKAKTMFGSKISADEFKLLEGKAQIEALLGLFRESVVGPGVMTEYDAVRVLNALGGDPASALQNPGVLKSVLSDVLRDKQERFRILQEQYNDASTVFKRGALPTTQKAPGTAPAAPTTPAAPTAPAAPAAPVAPTPIPLPPSLKDLPEGEIVKHPKTKEPYFRQGDKLVPVTKPTGPAGGPEGTPMAPIKDAPAAKGRMSAVQPQAKPIAAASAPAAPTGRQTPQQRMAAIQPTPEERSRRMDDLINSVARDSAGPIQSDPTAFLSYKPTQPYVQRAEPTGTPIAALQSPSQRLIEAGRRNAQLPADSEYADIEYRRRAATKQMDEAVGRPRVGAPTPKKKPRSYQIKRAADGSTIVTVLE